MGLEEGRTSSSSLLPLADTLPEAATPLGCSPRARRAAWFGPLPLPPRASSSSTTSVFHNVLADAHLFLDHRALVHDDLFLGYRYHDLVLTDLGP